MNYCLILNLVEEKFKLLKLLCIEGSFVFVYFFSILHLAYDAALH